VKIHDRDSAAAALEKQLAARGRERSEVVLRDGEPSGAKSGFADASRGTLVARDAPDDPPPFAAQATVSNIQPLDSQGRRVRICFEDGSADELSFEIWASDRFGLGDSIPAADRARLRAADLRWQARMAALDLLARRPYGRTELRRRLIKKGLTATAVDGCLAALAKEKLVDDDQFARLFVSDRLRLRPRGKKRLTQELREKGVEGPTAEAAVEATFKERGVDESALARDAALGWLKRAGDKGRKALAESPRSPDRQKAERRLGGFLARRGFGGEAARDAIRVAVDAAQRAATAS
jgi:regulatory protein